MCCLPAVCAHFLFSDLVVVRCFLVDQTADRQAERQKVSETDRQESQEEDPIT